MKKKLIYFLCTSFTYGSISAVMFHNRTLMDAKAWLFDRDFNTVVGDKELRIRGNGSIPFNANRGGRPAWIKYVIITDSVGKLADASRWYGAALVEGAGFYGHGPDQFYLVQAIDKNKNDDKEYLLMVRGDHYFDASGNEVKVTKSGDTLIITERCKSGGACSGEKMDDLLVRITPTFTIKNTTDQAFIFDQAPQGKERFADYEQRTMIAPRSTQVVRVNIGKDITYIFSMKRAENALTRKTLDLSIAEKMSMTRRDDQGFYQTAPVTITSSGETYTVTFDTGTAIATFPAPVAQPTPTLAPAPITPTLAEEPEEEDDNAAEEDQGALEQQPSLGQQQPAPVKGAPVKKKGGRNVKKGKVGSKATKAKHTPKKQVIR